MTAGMGSIWGMFFARQPLRTVLALSIAAMLGALALMFAFVVAVIAGVLGALAWLALRLTPRSQRSAPFANAQASDPADGRAPHSEVLEAHRTADGWVVEATRGG